MNNEGQKDPLTHKIIGTAIEVHRSLGPGLLEELFEDAFCIELQDRKMNYERQQKVNVAYKGKEIGNMYADIVVEGAVVVELKSVRRLDEIHVA